MIALETEKLTKDYVTGTFGTKRQTALDHLSLKVEQGEIFGLIGPNGAGKSTTLKLLMGLIFPTAGWATILGKPIGDRSMKARIGYLPEYPYFYDYLTGRELLAYYGQLFGLDGHERKARAEELLAQVGMMAAGDMPLGKYSKGMTQRIGIAQALINRPSLVFFDEPMSGLDPIGRREMALLIQGLRDQGVTVFFSSHILPDVELLCDRVAILNKGKLVESGRLRDILDVSVHAIEVVVEDIDEIVEGKLTPLAKSVRRTGARCRLEFADSKQFDEALGIIQSNGARLISVTPVKRTLEDHFLQEVAASESVPT